MTRILLVHQPVDGGVGRHVSDVARGLQAAGHEVALCGPDLPAALPASLPHYHLALERAIAPAHDGAATAALVRVIGRVRPEVVHAHSSKAGAIARLARIAHPGIPLLYSPHGYAFAGHFSRPRERAAFRQIERGLSRLTTRVICVCEAEARLALEVSAAQQIRVIYNGVEPTPPGPIDARIAELARAGPTIAALTLLRPGKGLETLLDAMPLVLSRHPHAQLAIAGGGPDLDALRGRALLAGLGHAVHFIGLRPDPLAVLRGADILVHPSWAESFPYVILEAMATRCAIVASQVGGIGEAVVNGESALLVAPRDAGALARALIELLDDAELRIRLAEQGHRRVQERFTRTAMVRGLSAVYEEVAAERFPPAARAASRASVGILQSRCRAGGVEHPRRGRAKVPES